MRCFDSRQMKDEFDEAPSRNDFLFRNENQLTINLVNMILSSTQQITSLFNLISAFRFFSSQVIGLLQNTFVLPT